MGFSLAVPRFGMIVEVNLARTFLHRAHDATKRGDLIAAGCLLREAVRRQSWAECSWKGCLPDGASERTPAVTLLRALRKAGHCGDCGFEIAKEMLDLGNRAAHCGRVQAKYLLSAIALFHGFIDNDPCGEPRERVEHCIPVEDCPDCDCDDDDGSDWWKSEGGAA